MARFLVELLINASGEPEVRAVFDNIGASAARSSKAVDAATLRTESSLRRTAEAAAKLKEQMAETGKSKSFISDMDALNKKLKDQVDHWKKGPAGIAEYAEKQRQAAEAQRILTAQTRAGVAADSEHGKKIADLVRQHDKYQSELDETKRKLAEQALATIKHSEDLKRWGSALSSTGRALTASVTLPLVGLSAASFKASNDLNKSLANISSLLTDIPRDALDPVLKGMKSGIQTLAVDLGKSTDDISNGLYEVISSLGLTNDSFGQLEIAAKAGTAGLASTQESFNFLSAVTKTYGDTSEEAFKKAASLGFQAVNFGQTTFPQLAASIGGVAPIAKVAGVSMEEMFAVIATATGVTGNTAEVVTQMASAINALLNPSKDLKKLYKELGVSSGEAMIQQFGFTGSLQKVAEYAAKTNLPMTELLGRKEAFILTSSLAGAQADKFTQNLKAMGEAAASGGTVLEEAFRRQTEGINQTGFAWEQAKVRASIALQEVGDATAPILTEYVIPLMDGVSDLAETFSSMGSGAKTASLGMAAAAASAGPLLFVSGQLLQSWGSLVTFAPRVAGAIRLAFAPTAVVAGITTMLLWIDDLIDKWKDALDAAIDYEIRAAQITGNALQKVQAIQNALAQAPEGRVSEQFFSEAQKYVTAVDTLIKETQTKIDKFYRDTSGGAGLDPKLRTAGPVAIKPTGLIEAEREMQRLIDVQKRLVPALASVTVETKKQSAAAADNNKNIGIATALTEAQEKALRQLRAEYEERGRYLRELQRLADSRPKEADRIIQEHKINEAHERRVRLMKLQEQFGESLGRALAKQADVLDDMEKDIKLKFSLLFTPSIKMDKSISKDFDDSMKIFLFHFKRSEEIARANAAAYAAVGIAHEEWLAEFTDGWRESWKTTRERFEEEMQAIRDAVALGESAGGMSAAEGERALAQVRSEMLDNHLNEWGSFFNTLGGMFGGLLQKISNAINAVLQGQQAGTQLGNAAGLSAGATSALGYMGATFAIFAEIYKLGSASLKRERARTFGDVTSAQVVGGKMSSPSYFDERGKEFSLALRDLIKEIEASLGAVLRDLPQITIRARKDGKEFSAYVAGIWIGTFRDAQQALEEGVRAAITQADFSAISKEFAIALKASVDLTFAELERNIETARTARRARIGDTGEQYVDLSDKWRQEIAAAQALGLATEDMIEARRRETNALKNSVLGIDTAVSDQLRAIGSLNAGITEAASGMRAGIEQQIKGILDQIAFLEAEARKPKQGGGPGGTSGGEGGTVKSTFAGIETEADAAIARLKEQLALYLAELDKIPQALSAQELSMGIFDALYKPFEGTNNKYSEEARKWARMRVDIEYELVRLELIRLGMWEQYQQMFNDSLAKAKELAGQGVGGGGRGRGRAQTRDELRDEIAGLRADSAGPLHSALFDVQQGIEDFSKRAREAKLPARELAEGVALMTEQFQRSVREQAEGFAGIGTDFTARLDSALDFFAEARTLGPGQTGLSEEALSGLEQSSLERLGSELANAIAQFGGLVNPMLAINRQADELRENILAYGQAAGWTAEQIAEAQAQISAGVEFQREQAINGILGTLFGYLEQDAQYQAQYAEFRRAEIDLQFRLIEAQLRALNMWDEATQQIFNAARAAAEAQINAAAAPPEIDSSYKSAASSGIDIFEDFEQAKARILEQLDEWNLSPLGELTKKASEMTLTFNKLMEDVVKLKPMGWDFTGAAIEAFEKAKGAFISGIFESIEAEVEGSPLVARVKEINTQFADIGAALLEIGASQADIAKAETLRLKSLEKAMDDWLKPITALLDENKFGELSTLTGEQQYKAAEAEFQKLTQGFLGGDLSITSEEIAAAAERFRELGREFTAGEGYRFIDKQITDTLLAIKASLPGLLGTATAGGPGSAPAGINPGDGDLTAALGALGILPQADGTEAARRDALSNVLTFSGAGGSTTSSALESAAVAAISGTTSAINTGNTLILSELRLANTELRRQTARLEQIDRGVAAPIFTTRYIA